MAFVPENPLEDALMRAAKDAAARPEFYRLLLESDLYVIGQIEGDTPGHGQRAVAAGERLQIESSERNGTQFLTVFSSLVRLQTYLREEKRYLSLNGRSLFAMTPGASFVLNPGSDYGKELLPGEIAGLLHPESVAPQHITIDKPTQVLIGQPAVYPHDLVEALKTAFAARAEVQAAYLVQIAYPDRNQPPHPLIGVETTGDWDPLSVEIGRIAAAAAPGLLLDLSRIDPAKPNETLTDSLLKTKPFYQRKKSLWGALFH